MVVVENKEMYESGNVSTTQHSTEISSQQKTITFNKSILTEL